MATTHGVADWVQMSMHVPWRARPDAIVDFNELRRRTVPVFKSRRVAASVFQQLHSSLAARLFPILAGDVPLNALEAYASVACAGRIVIVHASALIQEACDLFGRVESSNGRFVPHAAGLLDLLIAARASDGPALVVIDGVNRGPTESFLVPLVRSWVDVNALPIFHPNAVRVSDKYRAAASLNWPANIFLCGTLSVGPTTLPMSPDVWPYATLIETSVEPGDTSASDDVSEASMAGDVFSLDAPQEDELGADFQGVLSPISRSTIRYTRALRRFTADEKVIVPIVARAIAAPFVASQPEGSNGSMQQFVEQTGVEPKLLADAVERARRRIS